MVKFTNLAFLEVIIRFFVRIFLFFGVLTGFLEEICQIHFISAVGIFGKSDRFDQGLVVTFRVEKRMMNAAKIDEIQRSAAHDEHGLEKATLRVLLLCGGGGEIVEHTALGGQLELAYAHQDVVEEGGVGQQIGAEGDAAQAAELLLTLLGLNGKNL